MNSFLILAKIKLFDDNFFIWLIFYNRTSIITMIIFFLAYETVLFIKVVIIKNIIISFHTKFLLLLIINNFYIFFKVILIRNYLLKITIF